MREADASPDLSVLTGQLPMNSQFLLFGEEETAKAKQHKRVHKPKKLKAPNPSPEDLLASIAEATIIEGYALPLEHEGTMSHAQLAVKTGVCKRTIAKWEARAFARLRAELGKDSELNDYVRDYPQALLSALSTLVWLERHGLSLPKNPR